jgi:hypothetical protein
MPLPDDLARNAQSLQIRPFGMHVPSFSGTSNGVVAKETSSFGPRNIPNAMNLFFGPHGLGGAFQVTSNINTLVGGV